MRPKTVTLRVEYNNQSATTYRIGTYYLRRNFLQFKEHRIGAGELDIIIPYSNVLSIEIREGWKVNDS